MPAEIGTDIERAAALLRRGEIVAIPTETVYGLAANAFDQDAVLKVFEAKRRPRFDPLIVHVSSAEALGAVAERVPNWAATLVREFWPGPLTVVVRKRASIPDIVSSGLDTVGVRVPRHHQTLELLSLLDFPLAAPSANPFGYISPTRAEHVRDQLGNKVSYILDGGESEIGVESTIVAEGVDGRPVVLRPGGVPLEQLIALVGPIEVEVSGSSDPRAPGMLASHYAPHKRVILVDRPSGGTAESSTREFIGRSAVLAFDHLWEGVPTSSQQVLSKSGDVREAAKNLFHALRVLDALPVDVIYAERVPNTGLGLAINDRLTRASGGR